MIFLDQAPYYVRADWNGSDASATDNWAAIQQAANDAGTITPPGVDLGGTQGDTLILPRGSSMISKKLVLPFGVAMQGANDYGSAIILKSTFDPADHGIDIGDASKHLSAFGGALRNMVVMAPPSMPAASGTALVYTNNNQDTDAILHNVRLYSGQRIGFKGEIGYGGASIVRVRQVQINCSAALPCAIFNYGDGSLVHIDGLEPAGPRNSTNGSFVPGSIGLVCNGGKFDVRRFHPEILDWGIYINLTNAHSRFDGKYITGGPDTNHLVTIGNTPAQLGNITLARVYRNGVLGHIVYNGQSGATSTNADIEDQIRL